MGTVVVAHGLSCPAVCGIFLDQGSNLCPLHWQVGKYRFLSYPSLFFTNGRGLTIHFHFPSLLWGRGRGTLSIPPPLSTEARYDFNSTHSVYFCSTGHLLRALEQNSFPKEQWYSWGLGRPLVSRELRIIMFSSGQSFGVSAIFKTFPTKTVFKNSTRTKF